MMMCFFTYNDEPEQPLIWAYGSLPRNYTEQCFMLWSPFVYESPVKRLRSYKT